MVKEYHHIIRVSDPMSSFRDQMEDVLDKVQALSEGRKIFFLRFFISDAANQQKLLVESMSRRGLAQASLIQQPPLDGSKIEFYKEWIEREFFSRYKENVY